MKKIYLPIIAIFLVLVLFSPFFSKAEAKSLTVFGPSSSNTYFQGTTYGMQTHIIVSNPGINSGNSIYYWYRNAVLKHNTNSDQINSLVVGVGKSNAPVGNWCQSSKNYLLLYVEGFDSSGTHMYTYCDSAGLPSCMINKGLWINVNPYVSNGGGMLIQAKSDVVGCFTMTPQYWSYTRGAPIDFSRINYEESIYNDFTGHNVWGSDWTQNSWVEGNGTYVTQTVGASFLTAGNPPQMRWYEEPYQDNIGGDLLSCVYDTGTTCTSGS